jgi:hypothetical protein
VRGTARASGGASRIDGNCLPGDRRGAGRQKKHHKVGDVCRRRPARQALVRAQASYCRLGQIASHGGGHVPWQHGVHPDLPLAHLSRKCPRETEQRRLGRGVGGLPRHAEDGAQRGHVDDGAAAKVNHAGQHGPAAAECACLIDPDHHVPLGIGSHRQQTVMTDAGIVHQALDRPESGGHFADKLIGPRRVGQVENESSCRALRAILDLAGGVVVGPVGEGHRPSVGKQPFNDRAANALAAASHQRHRPAHCGASSRARATASAILMLSTSGR